MENTQEILQLLRENNELLKEIVSILRRTNSEEYLSQENTVDFLMNITANLIANSIEKNKNHKNG